MKSSFLIPSRDTLQVTFWHAIKNSSFEYEQQPHYAKASVVGQKQEKTYRIEQGVQTKDDSTYLKITNLQEDIQVGDRVLFMGEYKTVQSVGYFFDESLMSSFAMFNEEYIKARSPKGIAIN